MRGMTLRLTDEQLQAVEAYRSGQDLKVVAVAGSGKTTTLRLMAEADPGKRGLYLAFNRSVREEAARKFPRHVRPYTLHGLAYRMAVSRHEGYRAKFEAAQGHLSAPVVAEALEVRHPLLLHAVLGTLEGFLRSEAETPEPGMIPRAYRLARAGTSSWPEEEAFILRGTETLWRRMTALPPAPRGLREAVGSLRAGSLLRGCSAGGRGAGPGPHLPAGAGGPPGPGAAGLRGGSPAADLRLAGGGERHGEAGGP